MTDQAILSANDAFYRAFAGHDVAAMDRLWAVGVPVSCLHPGWGPLDGREAVMRSWRRILSSAGAPRVACRAPRLMRYGEVAAVVCFEEIEGQYLVATNLFVRQDDGWRMVLHQAGPTAERPGEEESPAPGRLH
ncbi:MAG: nuclear transport factor 2 family protein [Dongiaceae bacterium]